MDPVFCLFSFSFHLLLTLSLVVGMQKEVKLVERMTTEVRSDKLDEAFSRDIISSGCRALLLLSPFEPSPELAHKLEN